MKIISLQKIQYSKMSIKDMNIVIAAMNIQRKRTTFLTHSRTVRADTNLDRCE